MKFLTRTLVIMMITTSINAKTQFKFKKQKRTISSTQDLLKGINKDEKALIEELNNIVLSVSPKKNKGTIDTQATKKAVIEAIEEIKKIASEHPENDMAQLYKSVAEHIPLFEGFIYRLRNIVEVSDMAYISAIWALKQFKQTSSFRAPYIEALFEVLTAPNPGKDIEGQNGIFQSVEELQDWMVNKIAPKFEKTISEIKQIAYKSGNGLHPIGIVNAELVVGKTIADRYEPSKGTYKNWILTSGHLVGLVSTLENYMGFLYYLSAYNLEGVAEFTNILSKETFVAVDGATSRSAIIKSTSKRVEILSSKRAYQLTTSANTKVRKNKIGYFGKNSTAGTNYKNFLTIRPEAKKKANGHGNYLLAAKGFFLAAANDRLQYHEAMKQSYGLSNEGQLLVNPISYQAALDSTPYIDEDQVLEKSIEVLEANGPITLEDHLVSKKYTVDASVLFDINKVNDLRDFLPNQFLDTKEERTPKAPSGLAWFSRDVSKWRANYKWNYNHNKAVGWKDPTFGGLLPNISSEKGEQEMNLHLLNVASMPEMPFIGSWLSMFYGY